MCFANLNLMKYICDDDPAEPPDHDNANYVAFNIRQQKAPDILFGFLDRNTKSMVLGQHSIVNL